MSCLLFLIVGVVAVYVVVGLVSAAIVAIVYVCVLVANVAMAVFFEFSFLAIPFSCVACSYCFCRSC